MEAKKVAMSAISFILLMGVAIGIVALINSAEEEETSSPKMKAVFNFCRSTLHQETCQKTLSPVNSTDPQEFIKRAIAAAHEATVKFSNFTDSLIAEKGTASTQSSLALCKDFIGLALYQLNTTMTAVRDEPLRSYVDDLINDLRTWLSATMTFQQTCVQEFHGEENTKMAVMTQMTETDKVTDNALAIVTKLSDILGRFRLRHNISGTPRRLFSVTDGFPEWMGSIERKLIGRDDKSNLTPNAVVAQDGSGQFKTIQAALNAAPKKSPTRYIIHVKAGIYKENVTVDLQTPNILMYGDGPRKTVVSGQASVKISKLQTPYTSTFSVLGDRFIAKSIGFLNTADPRGEQAVALRVAGDKAAFFNCRIEGFQDTLYAQANRQFYGNCIITGTIDFIFGNSATVVQMSQIIVRRPLPGQSNVVLAHQQQSPNANGALVIQGCRVVPERNFFNDRLKVKTYLGRPWRSFGVHVFMENELGDLIWPEGWAEMKNKAEGETAVCAEYKNTGPGASTAFRVNRVGVKRSITKEEAARYTAGVLLLAKGRWLTEAGFNLAPGFVRP